MSMKVFAVDVDNGYYDQDKGGIVVLIAAESRDEATEFVKAAVKSKAEPFGTEYWFMNSTFGEPDLQTTLTETSLITSYPY